MGALASAASTAPPDSVSAPVESPAAASAQSGSGSSITPGLLSALGMGGTAASALLGAQGAQTTAAAESNAALYRAQVAANNEQIASTDAQLATATGAENVAEAGMAGKGKLGQIKASQAASNIDVNSGSAVDVQKSQAELSRLDALTLRSNAAKTAYGFTTEAQGFGEQQQLATAESANDKTAGNLKAFGSLLSGATSVGSKFLSWQQAAGSGGSGGSGSGSLPSSGFDNPNPQPVLAQ